MSDQRILRRARPPRLAPGRLRAARLLALPAASVVLAAEARIRVLLGADRAAVRASLRRRNADRTRRVLGDLKGGALKAGQLLSTVDALFPADPEGSWQEALRCLQESNPPVPFDALVPVLVEDLGAQWRRGFRRFDEQPVAAASLGQVHRAVTADGRAVAVKIQYPGIAEALRADLRALSWASRAASLLARDLSLPPLLAEMRARMAEELDYRQEGRAQALFARAYRDDREACVPDLVQSTRRVLITEWLEAVPLVEVARTGSQSERDLTGLRYQRFLLGGPARAGRLHCDPHPGNFRVLGDGRLGVLDFGSTLPMPAGLPPTFGRLIRSLLAEEPDDVLAALRSHGLLRPDRDVDVAKLTDYLAPFTEPARHEQFTYSRGWLRAQFGRINDPRNPDFAVALHLDLPAEHLFTHRVWLGLVGVLCQLNATVPVRPELDVLLPGFRVDS